MSLGDEREELAASAAGDEANHRHGLATSTERELAGMWAETLGLDTVSREHNFFEIGGDSLLATKVVLRARRRWDVKFTVAVLLATPVLKDLAGRIDELVADRPAPAAGARSSS